MQAKLPDINAALVRHRSGAIAAFISNDHASAIIALDAMIALLPDDFKIEINTEKYNQLVAEKRTIKCDSCTATPLLKDINLQKLLLPSLDRFIVDNDFINVWECVACTATNEYKPENITITKFAEPSYFKVVPSPPSKNGTKNRMIFDYEFKKWFNITLIEIENQIGIYRAAYQAQSDQNIPVVQTDDDNA